MSETAHDKKCELVVITAPSFICRCNERKLEREIAAAQAKWIALDTELRERDKQLIAAQAKLAKFEQAGRELPEGDVGELIKHLTEESQAGGELDCPICGQTATYLTKLRDYAIAQHVRADENERDAKRYQWLRNPNNGQSCLLCDIVPGEEGLDAAIDAAIAAGKEGKT